MAEAGAGEAGGKLLTLSEVSKRTRISMPTLQRYKREYQSRIPAEGKGRRQRYPLVALAVFEELKRENMGRRGRPRKSAAAPAAAAKGRGRRPRAAAKAAPARKSSRGPRGGLLTLTEVARRTGISYPTLQRYIRRNLAQLPHEGEGRQRRFHRDAVPVFEQLRRESRRGRPPKGEKPARRGPGRPPKSASDKAMTDRVQRLERTVAALEKALEKVAAELRKPLRVTVARG